MLLFFNCSPMPKANRVLTLNKVLGVMLDYCLHHDWELAFDRHLPKQMWRLKSNPSAYGLREEVGDFKMLNL